MCMSYMVFSTIHVIWNRSCGWFTALHKFMLTRKKKKTKIIRYVTSPKSEGNCRSLRLKSSFTHCSKVFMQAGQTRKIFFFAYRNRVKVIRPILRTTLFKNLLFFPCTTVIQSAHVSENLSPSVNLSNVIAMTLVHRQFRNGSKTIFQSSKWMNEKI